jgi:hypothetical protein
LQVCEGRLFLDEKAISVLASTTDDELARALHSRLSYLNDSILCCLSHAPGYYGQIARGRDDLNIAQSLYSFQFGLAGAKVPFRFSPIKA